MKRIVLMIVGVILGVLIPHLVFGADDLTDAVNQERAKHGLHALAHEPHLSSWAAANNDQQRARGLGHHVFSGTPASRQNAASGQKCIAEVVDIWMASNAHRAAMLANEVTCCGGATDGFYWTLNFGISIGSQPKTIEVKPAAPSESPQHGIALPMHSGQGVAACYTVPRCQPMMGRRCSVGRWFSFRWCR